MVKNRFGYLAAAIALTVVPLSGCDAASEKLSSADACGDLVEMSISQLRDVRESVNDPASVEQTLRDMAADFRAKASEIDDAQLEQAARDYADKMKELADKAAAGETPDLDAVVKANSDLAEACA